MSRDEWEQAMARAAVEGAFRARLLTDPVDALSDYGLPASDIVAVSVVEAARAASLPEFVGKMLRSAVCSLWPEVKEYSGEVAFDGEGRL